MGPSLSLGGEGEGGGELAKSRSFYLPSFQGELKGQGGRCLPLHEREQPCRPLRLPASGSLLSFCAGLLYVVTGEVASCG